MLEKEQTARRICNEKTFLLEFYLVRNTKILFNNNRVLEPKKMV